MPRWLKVMGIGCGGLVVLLVLGVVLVAVLAGPGTDTTDSGQQSGQQGAEKENKVAISQPLTVGETAWIVNSAEQVTQLTDDLGQTESGNFIVVDFEFTNNSSESITLDSSMLNLLDSEGRENEADTDKMLYIDPARDLFLKQVNPGVTEQGTAVFTVAPDSSGFVMEVAGGFFSGETGKIDLGF